MWFFQSILLTSDYEKILLINTPIFRGDYHITFGAIEKFYDGARKGLQGSCLLVVDMTNGLCLQPWKGHTYVNYKKVMLASELHKERLSSQKLMLDQ